MTPSGLAVLASKPWATSLPAWTLKSRSGGSADTGGIMKLASRQSKVVKASGLSDVRENIWMVLPLRGVYPVLASRGILVNNQDTTYIRCGWW